MPSLKEIKGRVGSVQSTLKITSAMKLVASSKLRRAQNAIEAMRPYEARLAHMLAAVSGAQTTAPAIETPISVADGAKTTAPATQTAFSVADGAKTAMPATQTAFSVADGAKTAMPATETPISVADGPARTAVVAFASNSSLCGAFNANAVRTVLQVLQEAPGEVTVYSVGRKMADAMRKAGHPSPQNFTAVAERPSYAPMAALAESLMTAYAEGKYARILLVYNHFVSSARQVPVVEQLLPASVIPSPTGPSVIQNPTGPSVIPTPPSPSVIPSPEGASVSPPAVPEDIIIEPSRKELLEVLFPKTLKLKLYAALLDSAAAEHAARTVAMQMATDNGNDLLQELVLQYNKSRQQKITAEILDLAGGQQQQ